MQKYDVVVIGAGPGGYVAAIRCAQLGLNTACVDAWLTPTGKAALGGTCLNVGCIPSKALLDSSHQYEQIKIHAGAHGITASEVTIDTTTMLARKDAIVRTLTQGIAGLFKKNKIDWLQGRGRLTSQTAVHVSPTNGSEPYTVEAGNIIIATGSVPAAISAPSAKPSPSLSGAVGLVPAASSSTSRIPSLSKSERWLATISCAKS